MFRQPNGINDIDDYLPKISDTEIFQKRLFFLDKMHDHNFKHYPIENLQHAKWLVLTTLLFSGNKELNITENRQLAMQIYEKLISENCLFAIYVQLQIIDDEIIDQEVRKNEIIRLLRILSNAQDSTANYILGKLYLGERDSLLSYNVRATSIAAEQLCNLIDIEKAIEYLQISVNLGHGQAALDLADIYLSNNSFRNIEQYTTKKYKKFYDLDQAILALSRGAELAKDEYKKAVCACNLAILYREKELLIDKEERRETMLYYFRLAAISCAYYFANEELVNIYLFGDQDLQVASNIDKADEILHMAKSPSDYYSNASIIRRSNLDSSFVLPRYLFWLCKSIVSCEHEWVSKHSIREIISFLREGKINKLSFTSNEELANEWELFLKNIKNDKYPSLQEIKKDAKCLVQKIYQHFQLDFLRDFATEHLPQAQFLPEKNFILKFSMWKKFTPEIEKKALPHHMEPEFLLPPTNEEEWRIKILNEISSVPDKLKDPNENFKQTYIRCERMMDWCLFNLKGCPDMHKEKMLENLQSQNPKLDKLQKRSHEF